MAKKKPFKIMFVCLGNICRSPLAHAVFQDLVDKNNASDRYELESSGTGAYHIGQPPDARMRQTAAAHGVTMDHAGRQLERGDLREYDLILAMDNSNLADIQSLAGGDAALLKKIRLFRSSDPEPGNGEVPDPYYGGARGFEEVFQIADRSCRRLFSELEHGKNV